MLTEKQKAEKGLLYDATHDEEIVNARNRCKELCFRYNQLSPLNFDGRDKLIRQILKRTGKSFCIEQPFYCDYGYNIELGENFYANHGCVILDGARVCFGDNVFIAPYCGFYTAGHALDAADRAAGLEYAFPITIGNNVWIGAHTAVLPGVTIGDNTVISAGSVVNRSIPSNVLAAGNPCKVIRPITAEDRNKYPRK